MCKFRNVLVILLVLFPINSFAVTAEVKDVRFIARLYSAAFDRIPKVDGLNFWVDTFDSGKSIVEIAQQFYDSPEFTKKYGALNNVAYVEQLFRNVLLREGNEAGIEFWERHLVNGVSRANVLAEFADSPENIAKTTETFADMRDLNGRWVFEEGPPPMAQYDFAAVDARMQQLVDETPEYNGISYILVDKEQGVVHRAAFGNHTLEDVFLIASTSKLTTASLLMAIDDDASVDFDITKTIDNYLPWEGVYGSVTTEQMLSNTSGIPGIAKWTPSFPSHPHACQTDPTTTLEACTESIYTNILDPTVPPGTIWDFGASSWQLAGGVAEVVTNSTWNQAFDKYIAQPCNLEVFQYGNMGTDWTIPGMDVNKWTGSADSLIGQSNPVIQGGAISNLDDYAKILLMHLRGGKCGDTQVITPESLASMREDRSGGLPNGWGYGLGMYLAPPTGFPWHQGYFGSIFWIGDSRGIGGFIAVDDYSRTLLDDPFLIPSVLASSEIILLHVAAVDEARAAVEQ
jgi:CubicO group peptidase (beta-lactamase class C family)